MRMPLDIKELGSMLTEITFQTYLNISMMAVYQLTIKS